MMKSMFNISCASYASVFKNVVCGWTIFTSFLSLLYTVNLTGGKCEYVVIRSPSFFGRKLMQGPINSPKAHLSNNFRPIQPLNQRILRTNIDFRKNGRSQVSTKVMKKRPSWDGWDQWTGKETTEREKEKGWLDWAVYEESQFDHLILPKDRPQLKSSCVFALQCACFAQWERAKWKHTKQRDNRFVYAFTKSEGEEEEEEGRKVSCSVTGACEVEIKHLYEPSALKWTNTFASLVSLDCTQAKQCSSMASSRTYQCKFQFDSLCHLFLSFSVSWYFCWCLFVLFVSSSCLDYWCVCVCVIDAQWIHVTSNWRTEGRRVFSCSSLRGTSYASQYKVSCQ